MVLLVVAGCGGGGGSDSPSPEEQAGAAVAVLKGVPQDGARLGAPNAPAKLTLFTSLTELNTAFVRSDLPELVKRFVKPGLLQIDLVTVDRDSTIGDVSGARQLVRVAQSAASRDHLWDFYVAFETYYDGTYQASQARLALDRIPSLTPSEVLGDARSDKVTTLVEAARKRGDEAPGVLPSFVLRGPGGAQQPISDDCLQCLSARVARTLGDTPAPGSAPSTDAKVQTNLRYLRGIPQDGITLGKLSAPATLSVYLAPGPASSALFANALPTILNRWVRPGRLRIQVRFEPPAKGRADAEAATTAARLATSAGVDDHLWDFLAALGARSTGLLDTTLLSAALLDVTGIEPAEVRARARTADISGAIARGAVRARTIGVKTFPAFVFDARRANNKRLDGSCPSCLLRSIAIALKAEQKQPASRPPAQTPAPVRTPMPSATRAPAPVRTASPRPAPTVVRTPTPPTPQPTTRPTASPKPEKTQPPKIPIKP